MWDVVKSCRREGSLDQDISDDVPNEIREFCQDHPTIKRIVIANGGTGCQKFRKHFRFWFDSKELVPGKDSASRKEFKKWIANEEGDNEPETRRRITCISGLAVSPAAARFSFEEKRQFWEDHVYVPGLQDFETHNHEQEESNGMSS
jgi:hypothetical protein